MLLFAFCCPGVVSSAYFLWHFGLPRYAIKAANRGSLEDFVAAFLTEVQLEGILPTTWTELGDEKSVKSLLHSLS